MRAFNCEEKGIPKRLSRMRFVTPKPMDGVWKLVDNCTSRKGIGKGLLK